MEGVKREPQMTQILNEVHLIHLIHVSLINVPRVVVITTTFVFVS